MTSLPPTRQTAPAEVRRVDGPLPLPFVPRHGVSRPLVFADPSLPRLSRRPERLTNRATPADHEDQLPVGLHPVPRVNFRAAARQRRKLNALMATVQRLTADFTAKRKAAETARAAMLRQAARLQRMAAAIGRQ